MITFQERKEQKKTRFVRWIHHGSIIHTCKTQQSGKGIKNLYQLALKHELGAVGNSAVRFSFKERNFIILLLRNFSNGFLLLPLSWDFSPSISPFPLHQVKSFCLTQVLFAAARCNKRQKNHTAFPRPFSRPSGTYPTHTHTRGN